MTLFFRDVDTLSYCSSRHGNNSLDIVPAFIVDRKSANVSISRCISPGRTVRKHFAIELLCPVFVGKCCTCPANNCDLMISLLMRFGVDNRAAVDDFGLADAETFSCCADSWWELGVVAGTVANGVGEGVSGSVLPVVAGTVATGVGKEVSGSVLHVVAGTVATGVGEGVSGSVYSLW